VLFFLSVTIPFTSLASTHPCASPLLTPASGSGTPPVQPPPAAGNLFINEVLLTPHSTWNCSELGTYTITNDAWVEIYNSQDVAYDLSSAYTALDSGPNTDGFYFPNGSVIEAHSFLVVFPRASPTFTDTETTTLRLLISGIPVDEVKLPTLDMPTDIAYGRTPDGSTTWQWLSTPTIDASNPSLPPTVPATPSRSHRTPVAVLTADASGKRQSGNNSGVNTSATNDGQTGTSDASTLVDGVQPTWNKMPMPDLTSPSPTAPIATTVTATTASSGTAQAPKVDSASVTTRKIAITLVAIALACSLIWCWKLFISPDPRKQKG
jgi:hypothetical protein